MSNCIVKKGSFVRVNNDVGVIVKIAGEDDIPEEHLGVWYGETTVDNIPKIRTVLKEYCHNINTSESYH